MNDSNLDENHFKNDSNCNIVNLQCPNFSQGMKKNVSFFTFSVGDTTISIQQDN